MIVTRAIRVNRCVESLHQRTREKGNAGKSSAKQGLIDDPIDKRAPGEIADWTRLALVSTLGAVTRVPWRQAIACPLLCAGPSPVGSPIDPSPGALRA